MYPQQNQTYQPFWIRWWQSVVGWHLTIFVGYSIAILFSASWLINALEDPFQYDPYAVIVPTVLYGIVSLLHTIILVAKALVRFGKRQNKEGVQYILAVIGMVIIGIILSSLILGYYFSSNSDWADLAW